MNEYQQQILDHYKNPHHYGKLEDFNHTLKLQNLSCGDEIEVFLKVEDSKIVDASFLGVGCSISIAASSLLLDEIIGKDINVVKQLTIENILEMLGIKLTMTRQKCAYLSLETVQKALLS